MGAVNVWEVESTTEFEAARGRSPQAHLKARHRDLANGTGPLPVGTPYRFCELGWFPRFICEGPRQRFTLYQIRGVKDMVDGVYAAAAPDPAVKVILQRWFGNVA